jgi:hypothetical protein
MSKQNVEIVHLFAEPWERSDWDGMTELVDLRDGRIVRVQGYMDRDTALEAAGLEGRDVLAGS